MLNTGVVISKRWENTTFSSTTSFQYLKDYMLMDIDYMAADFMQMEERQHQKSITHEMVVKGQMGLTEAETNRAFSVRRRVAVDDRYVYLIPMEQDRSASCVLWRYG